LTTDINAASPNKVRSRRATETDTAARSTANAGAAAGTASVVAATTIPAQSGSVSNDEKGTDVAPANEIQAQHGGALTPRANSITTAAQPAAPSAPLAPATEQVLNAIEPMAHRADGSYHLKLSLNPHELGRVELSIELRDGVLAVHMSADRPETQRMLTEQLGKLREMLDERGVSMGSLDVGDHSSRSAYNAPTQNQDGNPTSRRAPESPRVERAAQGAQPAPVGRPTLDPRPSSTHLLDVHA
jgi:flagellar hook-length control protein FliK